MRFKLTLLTLFVAACASDVQPGEPTPDGGHPDAGLADASPHALDAGPLLDGGPREDAAEAPSRRARYTTDRTLSPITPNVVERMQDILLSADGQAPDVFAKMGASATVSSAFLHCFDTTRVELDGRDELAETIAFFGGGDAGGFSPFGRQSLSATVGWTASDALRGDPAPYEQEINAASPLFAVIMYGSNDAGYLNPFWYGENLWTLLEGVIARGVIPIVSNVMPRDDSPAVDAYIAPNNMIVRALAESLQIPFIDFHRELMALEGHGLASDNVHPNTYSQSGSNRPCVFTDVGLQYGYNLRNLITIQTLDRVRRTLLEGEAAPDEDAPARRGAGTLASPHEIDALPFADLGDTSASDSRLLDRYDGCAAPQNESGPEVAYTFTLTEETTVRAMVIDRGATDVDIHLLGDEVTTEGCIARGHNELVRNLAAGTYHLVVDSFTSGSSERSGRYLLAVMEQE